MGAKLEFDNTGIASVVSEKSRSELDDIVFASIIDRDLTAPPSAEPTNGDRYIPKATATGDWDGKEDSIMFWHGYWAEIKPTRNMRAWLEDELTWIEYDGNAWVYVPPALLNVITKTANYTILTSECGAWYTNTGAGASVEFQLPSATVGLHYNFTNNEAAKNLQVQPASTETISLPLTGVPGSADKFLMANAIGESISLACIIAGNWIANAGQTPSGIWTIEA